MIGFIAVLAIGLGYDDASWDYPIARRQYPQITISTIITAGIFGTVYLLAHPSGRTLAVSQQEGHSNTYTHAFATRTPRTATTNQTNTDHE